MKKIVIIHFIASILCISGMIWTIAETLMYFIKNTEFNHGCFMLLGSGILLAFANMFNIFRKFD